MTTTASYSPIFIACHIPAIFDIIHAVPIVASHDNKIIILFGIRGSANFDIASDLP